MTTGPIDSLDGSDADECVQFGVDGYLFAIDLNARHATELRSIYAPLVQVAHPVKHPQERPPMPRSELQKYIALHNKRIREWARNQALPVAGRGRLSDAILDAYAKRTVDDQRDPERSFDHGQ